MIQRRHGEFAFTHRTFFFQGFELEITVYGIATHCKSINFVQYFAILLHNIIGRLVPCLKAMITLKQMLKKKSRSTKQKGLCLKSY